MLIYRIYIAVIRMKLKNREKGLKHNLSLFVSLYFILFQTLFYVVFYLYSMSFFSFFEVLSVYRERQRRARDSASLRFAFSRKARSPELCALIGVRAKIARMRSINPSIFPIIGFMLSGDQAATNNFQVVGRRVKGVSPFALIATKRRASQLSYCQIRPASHHAEIVLTRFIESS